MGKTIKARPPRKGRTLFRRWQLQIKTADERTLRGRIESVSFTQSKCSEKKPAQQTVHVVFVWLASLEQGDERLVWRRQKRSYTDVFINALRSLTFKETLKIEIASWKRKGKTFVFTSTLGEQGTLFPPLDSSNLVWKNGEFVLRPAQKVSVAVAVIA